MSTAENTLGMISLKSSKITNIKFTHDVLKKDFDENILAASYLISVINLSSKCLTIAGTRRIGASDAEWKWTPIPKTCRNCSSSMEQCFKEKRFSAIMSTDCTSAPFELFVGYAISETEAQGGVFDITPNCSVAGGVIGITD